MYQFIILMYEMWLSNNNIRDQAALNILYYEKENSFFSRERIKLYNINDNWCLHCAVGGQHNFDEWDLEVF